MVLVQVQAKYSEIEGKVKAWVAKQPPAVEVAVISAASALQGGVIGGLMGTFTADMAENMPNPTAVAGMTPDAAAQVKQMQAIAGGPWVQARNFAVMTGVNAGITAGMKRARGGKEDLQTSATAAFGSGVAFSLVSGVGGGAGNPVMNAVSTGAAFAVFQGAFFQIGKAFSPDASTSPSEFEETKCMLTSLGLTKYEKNFKKGLLTDATLPLLNDSALQEVKIPPGPRLLILNHIQRTKSHTGKKTPQIATTSSITSITSSDKSTSSGAVVASY